METNTNVRKTYATTLKFDKSVSAVAEMVPICWTQRRNNVRSRIGRVKLKNKLALENLYNTHRKSCWLSAVFRYNRVAERWWPFRRSGPRNTQLCVEESRRRFTLRAHPSKTKKGWKRRISREQNDGVQQQLGRFSDVLINIYTPRGPWCAEPCIVCVRGPERQSWRRLWSVRRFFQSNTNGSKSCTAMSENNYNSL